MGASTSIEWTNATWNPWRGCTKVSPGCASCYMFRDQVRYGHDPTVVVRAASATFSAPLKWKEPKLVFTCSWSDFFHEDADQWRAQAWDIIRATPHLTYQILTKRPERFREGLPVDWGNGWPNVWLGVSTENQRMFDVRIGLLIGARVRLRFLSIEPLLGPVSLFPWLAKAQCAHGNFTEPDSPMDDCNCGFPTRSSIDWVIVGGESGGRPGHPPRVMKPEWTRSIRDECVTAGVPFFFKQWGGKFPGGPALLDGREWRQMPAVTP